jgi:hypothetical protein
LGEWVESTGKSWYEAGLEFRRRMEATGANPDAGETWLVRPEHPARRREP